MTAPSPPSRMSLSLPDELRERLIGVAAPRGALTGALLRCVSDATSMYGLPQPVREWLENDMRSRRFGSQRDYLIWLLLERYRAVRDASPRAEAAR